MKNKKKIIIFGAGVTGREIFRIIKDINKIDSVWEVLGFIDNNMSNVSTKVDGLSVFDIEGFMKIKTDEQIYFVCGVMQPKLREKIVNNEALKNNLIPAIIVHPSVDIPDDCVIGEGSVIYKGTNISFNVNLGAYSIIFYNSLLGHDFKGGDYITVLPYAVINGTCKIGSKSLIGSRVVIHPMLEIGSEAIIGIGTTLFENVKDRESITDIPRRVKHNL
jgi:sugar O-acyltransferase (sialic acid O-acetyltransferase NeuD family)